MGDIIPNPLRSALKFDRISSVMKTRTLACVLSILPAGLLSAFSLPERGLCAHRGDRARFPENTVPAFESAVRKGAAMVEFDVTACKTGELVILHDETVDRTTDGCGKIADLPFVAVRALDAGIKKHPKFKGTRIPTLEEALDCFPRTNVWLNVHCDAAVAARAARLIAARGRLHQAFVASTPEGVKAARAAVPGIRTCLMKGPWRPWTPAKAAAYAAAYVDEAVTNGYAFAQPQSCRLPPHETARFHAAGGKFTYFWLTDPTRLPDLFAQGIDFPLVDELDRMLAAYRAWEKDGCPATPPGPEVQYRGDALSGNDAKSLQVSALHGLRQMRGIPYLETTDPAQIRKCKVDVRWPANVTNFATVVWFHGGGLTSGGRHYIPLSDTSIAQVTADYRYLDPSNGVFGADCIRDAAAAVAWTLKNVASLGGETNRVYVAGHSAGGYLSLMVALDPRYLGEHGLSPLQLAGVIAVSGQATDHFAVRAARGDREPQFQPKIGDLSPLAHVTGKHPPLLSICGDPQYEIPGRPEENRLLIASCRALGHSRAHYVELPCCSHGRAGELAIPYLELYVQGRLPLR